MIASRSAALSLLVFRSFYDALHAELLLARPFPAGHFSAAGAAVCSACPSGRFAADEGQAACKNCPAGTQSFTAATSCFGDCPCGKEFQCSCSFGEQLSYNVTVPVQEKGPVVKQDAARQLGADRPCV